MILGMTDCINNRDEKMEGIQNYMVKLANDFHNKTSGDDFWDYVVISAADEQQKECFQQQLNEKLKNGELPKRTDYLVIADCPGCPLGSGGSTFYILRYLFKKFDEQLYEKKILLSHAGGFSKRLPNLSCIGKLFCTLPLEVEGKPVNILNLKMIITSPFLKFMKNGGLFVCASDDIETYCLDGIVDLINEVNELTDDGLVALAHPSSITIGNTHGVYVLPDYYSRKGKNCWLSPCLEVLQKPSYSTMIEREAMFNSCGEEKKVYTDSMFWCRPKLVQKMVTFALESADLYNTETCIYGNFLASMGTRSTKDKLYWNTITPGIKYKIATHFADTPISTIVLERSRFYHLGTMPEYLDNLNPSSELFLTLGMKPHVQSLFGCDSKIKGVVTTSLLYAQVEMENNSIMDSCIITVPVVCEQSTIISNCLIDDPIVKNIPEKWLFHTAALKHNNSILYVTVAFCIHDDLKDSVANSNGWKIANLERPSCSLWQARLFEAHDTMGKSFAATWRLVENLRETNSNSSLVRFSMEDVVKLKYIPALMEHRRTIIDKIKSNPVM